MKNIIILNKLFQKQNNNISSIFLNQFFKDGRLISDDRDHDRSLGRSADHFNDYDRRSFVPYFNEMIAIIRSSDHDRLN